MQTLRGFLLVAMASSLALLSPEISASSIQKMGFTELAQKAEFIFQGEVVARESKWNQTRSSIDTYVSFRVVESYKGTSDSATLVLSFAGGQVGDDRLVYDGLRYPQVGERGVYFVASLVEVFVNPLLGWSQGHYTLKNGHILSSNGKPVMQINASFKKTNGEFAQDGAGGLELGSEQDIGMSLSEFKSQISSALNK